MNRLIENCAGWHIGAQSEYPINFFVDAECLKAREGDLNVAYIIEPEEVISSGFYSRIIEIHHLFKYILTDKEEILKNCSNAVLFEYGTAWIQENPHPQKIHGVSTIIGFKNSIEGHILRHSVWRHKAFFQVPHYFYGSFHGGPANENNDLIIDQNNRDQLFKYEFQIVIENKKTDYWFTEKLCDCFSSRVVPIYYGARRIGDYFDTRGMIIVDDLAGIIRACNGIRESTYNDMLPYINENENRVKAYFNLGDRVTRKLKELFE
jgi:hypothetical protein